MTAKRHAPPSAQPSRPSPSDLNRNPVAAVTAAMLDAQLYLNFGDGSCTHSKRIVGGYPEAEERAESVPIIQGEVPAESVPTIQAPAPAPAAAPEICAFWWASNVYPQGHRCGLKPGHVGKHLCTTHDSILQTPCRATYVNQADLVRQIQDRRSR